MALALDGLMISLPGRNLVKPFSVTIAPGTPVLLMGPSGSGKSSLLSAIGGDLGPPFTVSGQMSLNGQNLLPLPPEQRRVGRLYQDDLLFPHLTVGENLLFGMARGARPERLARMRTALREAGLEGLEDRNPATLSGGQKARAALFRALLAEPAAMLLDEPFAKLDQPLRQALRTTVYGQLAARGIPTLVVSHDHADAPPGGRILNLNADGEVAHA